MSRITQEPVESRPRAVRGLVLVFALSFLSLIGVLLTVMALGGLGEWNRWQFIGLFGMLECASGLANIVLPNVWRLPVAEVQTRSSTKVHLAPGVLLIPHWAGAGRAAAGMALMAAGAWSEGIGPATLLLVPFILLLAWIITAASLIVARYGVDRPDLDVVQIVIRRPKGERALPAVSIGASTVQFLLSIATIPIVKALPPSAFYVPEIGCSWALFAATCAAAVALLGAVLIVWRGRIDWEAPREQQREAEKFA